MCVHVCVHVRVHVRVCTACAWLLGLAKGANPAIGNNRHEPVEEHCIKKPQTEGRSCEVSLTWGILQKTLSGTEWPW